ncbi:MAG: TrmH family RNA methyltransferase [Patescibacteria group bacterium]
MHYSKKEVKRKTKSNNSYRGGKLSVKEIINNKIESILILPSIRSALNVGAMFRTADAVGISKIYLTGTTPSPSDRFGRVQKDIAKSALGAETWVSWEYKKSLPTLISKLKKDGFKIIAIEQDKRAVDYRKVSTKSMHKVAIILGPEVEGLDKKILDKCDATAYIPMHGKKESLNVSVAAGIALFRILGK